MPLLLNTKVAMLPGGKGSAVIGKPISATNPPPRSFGHVAQKKLNAPGSAPINLSNN
jgi:hypothetical protein